MKIILNKKNGTFDITNSVVSKFKLSGDKQKASRILSFEFLALKDTDVDIINSDKIILIDNEDNELFRGIVLKNSINQDSIREVKVYDMMFYLNANKDTFVFKKKKASEIFRDVCSRFEIPIGEVDDSGYSIDGLTCKNKTAYDTIIESMAITYKNTNERYYIRANRGRVDFLKRRNQAQILVLETRVNINKYSISEDATELRNRVKLVTNAGALENVATKNDVTSQNDFGVLQYYKRETEFIMPAAAEELAATILKEKSVVNKKISIKCLGDNSIISGNAVILNIPELRISKAFYVDGDVHTYDDGFHEMSLILSETNEV